MATLVNDAAALERLIAERAATGADRYDEVWEGAYMMNPLANNEHQRLALRIALILQNILGWSDEVGEVFAGVNLSDRETGWEHNFRAPDVALFLKSGTAKNCGTHWCGSADLLVEIISRDDQSREKLPFYGQLGVRELLLIDRDPWALELYRPHGSEMRLVARDTLEQPTTISLMVLPLDLRLQAGSPRPLIEVVHRGTTNVWQV
jgi:Uma2 family endonuclease